MLLKIFTVYDLKAEAYMQPVFMVATGQMVRSFADTCEDKTHAFNKHPTDYELFEIGTYDDSNASITMHEHKIHLGSALENITQQEMPLDAINERTRKQNAEFNKARDKFDESD